MKKIKRLSDAYRFPGFKPKQIISGIFGDPKARVVRLNRIQKKLVVRIVVRSIRVIMIERSGVFEIFPVATHGFTSNWRFAESPAGIV